MKSVFLAWFFLLASSLGAGYVNTELLYSNDFNSPESLKGWRVKPEKNFQPRGGVDGKGALVFKTSGDDTDWLTSLLDPNTIKGLIRVEATIRGKDLKPGGKSYFGTKVMLRYKTGSVSFYPEPVRSFGSYDWKKVELLVDLPANTSEVELYLGLQGAPGEFRVDNVKIYRCIESNDETAAVKPGVNLEAAKIPRGPGKGTRYRGVMSGGDLSPEAFRELAAWNVNLLRYQLGPGKRDVSTPEKYLAWIDDEIKKIDTILPLCKEHGIKLIVDLHRGPGTQVTEVSSNVLSGDTNLGTLDETWKRLAGHFKGNPLIYGYDLLNEPVNTGQSLTAVSWQQIAERLVNVIRAIDPETPIIVEPFAAIDYFEGLTPIKAKNIIYSPHFYQPFSYSHQGVFTKWLKWSYPGVIDGTYWDKDQLRVAMKSTIEFQRKYNVPIFVGEFSAIAWARGGDRYLADTIELMEEYGWDWTYHAFREWAGWSVEFESAEPHQYTPSIDNPRKRVLLEGLQKNRK